jgi:hypothetical protein
VGETVVSPAWQITVLEVVRGAEAAQRITEANQFNDPAPEGQEYLLARVRVQYLGDAAPDATVMVDQSSFKITGSANVVYDRPSIVAPRPALDASLFPGGQVEGWVVVQAPADEGGLTLIFEPLFEFGNANVRFLSIE